MEFRQCPTCNLRVAVEDGMIRCETCNASFSVFWLDLARRLQTRARRRTGRS